MEIQTKIDKGPFNSFSFVLLLFKYKHVVVEELLQLLIGEIDTQLFETVELNREKKSPHEFVAAIKIKVNFIGERYTNIVFYLLNEFNTSLQIKTKVNKDPVNALSLIFFLLQYKHVMVEELLEFFICEIDTQLFEAIELHDNNENGPNE
ncbi:hypothetical protein HAZT_HAZT001468 [Hyalella azteca]|uniref:Uncharacterized protein n=1 Tax=Hyalella azteca TaxID=294128 RepID=A0A6A0GW31_HYAAZ|nr:hypothetical protein HAZT_HAZT001468 [Hyalella azteca]